VQDKNKQKRILVVEDERDILEFVSRALEFEGYNVSQATDGESGLKMLKEQPIDMVILDLHLPVRDGFSFLQERKERLELSAVPVLVVSAWADASRREKASQLGATKYMVKPFTLAALIENVALIMGAIM
jgi:DNA-binding response OmpR family regulator